MDVDALSLLAPSSPRALLDLSDWVERRIELPSTTSYRMDGGQVIMDLPASERGGIQPTLTLHAEGANGQKDLGGRISVKAGECVHFCADVVLTGATGALEEAVWDFTASDDFLSLGTVGRPYGMVMPGLRRRRRNTFSPGRGHTSRKSRFPPTGVRATDLPGS